MKNALVLVKRNSGKALILVCAVILLVVAAVGVIKAVSQPKQSYRCFVDTDALGVQPVDLCSLVPEYVLQHDNVVVTGGLTAFPTTVRMEGDPNTVYYTILTGWQQVKHLAETPPTIRFFERYGFFGGLVAGIVLVPVSILSFRLVRALYRAKIREDKRKERRQARPVPEGLTGGLNSEA